MHARQECGAIVIIIKLAQYHTARVYVRVSVTDVPSNMFYVSVRAIINLSPSLGDHPPPTKRVCFSKARIWLSDDSGMIFPGYKILFSAISV